MTANSTTRIERGFIGAHSDIGGGYAEGDMSDVAFNNKGNTLNSFVKVFRFVIAHSNSNLSTKWSVTANKGAVNSIGLRNTLL
ncbi:MAG: hypothetical protein ABW096_15445 [Candidatus Thiodiazotropha sp.]